MNVMRENLLRAFPSLQERELSNQYIEEHPNLFWDVPDIPLIRAVPLYILWCVEHGEDDKYLIVDDTISALNKYAREKGKGFKFSCSSEQVEVIIEFLVWCKSNYWSDIEPMLSRAIKNWKIVAQLMSDI